MIYTVYNGFRVGVDKMEHLTEEETERALNAHKEIFTKISHDGHTFFIIENKEVK